MKIFFEEHSYKSEVVKPYLHDHYLLYLKDDKVQIPYVGYYYSKEAGDTIFVLPKVFINIVGKEEEKAFGKFNPNEIIDTTNEDNPLLKSSYYKEIFNLSTWIYRAIATYRERHNPENITENVDVLNVQSIKGGQSETWIDIILKLIRFNNEHRNLFTYIARINAQGQNRINWRKTISRVVPTLQDESPIYLRFFNKNKVMNLDEELLVLFYSVLDYLHVEYNFKIIRNLNYQTYPKEVGNLIESGKGTRLLRSIRRKYFKDELVELWNLLNVFFKKAEKIAEKGSKHEEALMVRNFNLVFEDMIDMLISDDTKEKHDKLKDQPDGKIVDHIYRYKSLIQADDIYYIGDSKYYKEGHDPGENSIFKQFTYAKNVIQMNMDLLPPNNGDLGRNNYFDKLTEGYNITPNFFIRGIVSPDHINYTEDELDAELGKDGKVKVETRKHHENRLFDRDTLFVQKYNINFLFVLSAYVMNTSDESYRKNIHDKFRRNLISWLAENYSFYVMRRAKGVSLKNAIYKHFRLLNGKIFARDNDSVFLGVEPADIDSLASIVLDTQKDFEIYHYDIETCKIGNLYEGPKLPSIELDFKAEELIKELLKNGKNMTVESMIPFIMESAIQMKYWGMNQFTWRNVLNKYMKRSKAVYRIAAEEIIE